MVGEICQQHLMRNSKSYRLYPKRRNSRNPKNSHRQYRKSLRDIDYGDHDAILWKRKNVPQKRNPYDKSVSENQRVKGFLKTHKLVRQARRGVRKQKNFQQEKTNIFHAILKNDLGRIRTCCQKWKEIIRMKDNYGRTPLFYASELGREDIVKFLYQNFNASLETPAVHYVCGVNYFYGPWTPFLVSAKHGHQKITEWLVSKGCWYIWEFENAETYLGKTMMVSIQQGLQKYYLECSKWKDFLLPCLFSIVWKFLNFPEIWESCNMHYLKFPSSQKFP
jgi:hypothetical protein